MHRLSLTARLISATALLAVLGVIAAPALGARSHASAAAVTVTATDFKFKLSKLSAPHGKVIFTFVNKGKVPHDFKISGKKTSLMNPGKSTKLTVTLAKGKFKYLCTVPGHAALGMKGTFTAT
jgi:plastocyanin